MNVDKKLKERLSKEDSTKVLGTRTNKYKILKYERVGDVISGGRYRVEYKETINWFNPIVYGVIIAIIIASAIEGIGDLIRELKGGTYTRYVNIKEYEQMEMSFDEE